MYDPTALDDDDYDDMDIGARRDAEKIMGKRDREEAATSGRLRRGLLYGIEHVLHIIQLFASKHRLQTFLCVCLRL